MQEGPGKGASINILSRILSYIKEIFGHEDGFVAVEMGESFMKIAEVSSGPAGREVSRLAKRPLEPRGEGTPETIREIFKSLNISRRNVRLNIPRHLVTVRFLKLPATDEDEIRKMARIESLRHVPYGDEDMVAGYRVIEKMDDGYSNIMIAIAQAETVRRETDPLRLAGLTVESVSLGSETLLLWYMAARDAGEKVSTLLVNIAAGHIDVDVVMEDKLLFTRGALYDPSRPNPSEKIVDQIVVSILAYRKESGRRVEKVVLSGIPSRVNETKPLLAMKVDVPVECIDQMKNIPKAASAVLEPEEASFIELLGLQMKPGQTCINLLPERAQEEQRLEVVKKNIMTSLAIILLIITVSFAVVLKKLHDKKAYITYVDNELKKISPQVKTAKRMAKEIDLVTSKIAERPLAIDILNEIFKVTPPGVTLTTMEYESNKAVTLRGTTPGLSDIFKYVATLESSPYFANVKVRYANKRISETQAAADFEIICPISKAK